MTDFMGANVPIFKVFWENQLMFPMLDLKFWSKIEELSVCCKNKINLKETNSIDRVHVPLFQMNHEVGLSTSWDKLGEAQTRLVDSTGQVEPTFGSELKTAAHNWLVVAWLILTESE